MFMGKPHTTIIEYLREARSISSRSMAIVGDRLYTDIALGCNASILSICVLTGESDRAAVSKAPCKPDLAVESVAELGKFLI